MDSIISDEIERSIRIKMNQVLSEKGFDKPALLLKSINLPAKLSLSIKEKL